MLIGYTVVAIQHASDPVRHGPGGGTENFVSRSACSAGSRNRRDSRRRHHGHRRSPSRRLPRARDHGPLATPAVRGADTGRSRAGPPLCSRWVRHRGNGLDRTRGWGANTGGPPLVLTGRGSGSRRRSHSCWRSVSRPSSARRAVDRTSSAGSPPGPVVLGASLGIIRDLLPGAGLLALAPDALQASRSSRSPPPRSLPTSCSGHSSLSPPGPGGPEHATPEGVRVAVRRTAMTAALLGAVLVGGLASAAPTASPPPGAVVFSKQVGDDGRALFVGRSDGSGAVKSPSARTTTGP